jgi:hypothetical protein
VVVVVAAAVVVFLFLLGIRKPVHFVSYFITYLESFSAAASVHTFMFRHSGHFGLFEHDGWCWVNYLFISKYIGSLRAGRSGNRIPVVARFPAPVQTGPGAHAASYTIGTVSFPGVKRPGRGVDHPPPSSAEVNKRVGLYLYSPCGPTWPDLW